MHFIGYYPGIDFCDPSQFGRVVHARHFIESYSSAVDEEAIFVVGRSGEFERENVREIGFGTSFGSKLLRDVVGFFLLLRYVISADEQVVLYCRDSPYLSKLAVGLLPNVCLVVEVNGLAESEGTRKTVVERAFSWVRDRSRRATDLLVVVSRGIEDRLRSRYDSSKLAVVENGVDTELFRPDGEPGPHQPTLCYVGGLQEWQGIERMVSVLSLLDGDVRFYVVGGTGSRREEVREFARKAGVEDRVELVGRVDHSAVPDYINEADVCFGPFKSVREASPIKIYEYLSCGKHVVLLNDTGLEYVDDYPGVRRLSTDRTDREIADTVTELLSGPSSNDAGREYVERRHSWNSVARRVRDLVDQFC